MSLPATNTPPDSPGLLPVVTLNDEQATEMANAIEAMQMATTTPSSHFPSCQVSPGNPPPSHATETATAASGSPSLCHACSAKSLSQVEVLQLAKQFLDVLKSLSINQGPPPPPAAADKAKSEELPARASKLEFKTVNEVYVFRGKQVQHDGANPTHTAGTQKHTSTRSWNR